MKKILLYIMALFVANTAIADSYFYIDNYEFPHYKQTITLPIKAHFDGRVSGFQIDVTYPEGLTPTAVTTGSDMTIAYLDANGDSNTATIDLRHKDDCSLMMTATDVGGYWDTDGSGNFEEYGVIKWEPGEYDEMIVLTLRPASGFESGQITVNSKVGAGTDTRGGTVIDQQTKECAITRLAPTPIDPYHYFTIGHKEVLHGDTIVIPVSMTNTEEITAFQVDLYLPEGFKLVKTPAKSDSTYLISTSDRLSNDHEIYANGQEDGAVRIMCYSPTLQPIKGNDGELFYLTVATPDDQWGDFELALVNGRMTLTSFIELKCGDAEGTLTVLPYLKGDANNSRNVTVTDVVVTAQHVLGYNPDPFIFGAADMNEDGEITVTDVVLIANLVLHPESMHLMRAPALGMIDDAMSSEGIRLNAGESRTVHIALDNAIDYTAFQFDLSLPQGLTASNFRLTNRASSHALDMNTLDNGKQRVMCFSPQLASITGHEGAVLAFDVTAVNPVNGDIMVDDIEMVTAACQTVYLDSFNIGVNNGQATSVNDINEGLRIYADGHDIIVESPVSQRVTISDISGRSRSIQVNAGRNVIPTNTTGTLVVTAGGKAAKIMVK